MTLCWVEGVEGDAYTTFLQRKYRATISGPQIGLNYGRNGGNCLRDTSGVLYTQILSDASPENNTWVIGFAFYMGANSGAGTPTGGQIAGIRFLTQTLGSLPDPSQVSLQLERVDNFIYRWNLRTGNTLTDPLIDSSPTFWAERWYYFELKVTVDPSAGSYELRQDGVTIMSGSGVNTAAVGTPGSDSVVIHMDSNFAGSPYHMIDDIYILNDQGSINNDFLGDCMIQSIHPNGDGDQQDFTPSSAVDHYTLVDETTSVDDATKLTGDTTDQKELFEFGSPSKIVDNIVGIQISTCHAMQSSGSRQMKHVMRDLSDNENEGSLTIISSLGTYSTAVEIVELEPQGGAAWTKSDIDNYQFGVRISG